LGVRYRGFAIDNSGMVRLSLGMGFYESVKFESHSACRKEGSEG